MPYPAHVGVHVAGVHLDLTFVLAVSALAAGLLCALAVAVYRRRRSRAYLLVTLALGALLARPLVAALSAATVIPAETHHVLEHGLDALVVVLLLGAVYYARTIERRLETEDA